MVRGEPVSFAIHSLWELCVLPYAGHHPDAPPLATSQPVVHGGDVTVEK